MTEQSQQADRARRVSFRADKGRQYQAAHLFCRTAGLEIRDEDALTHFRVLALEDHYAQALRALLIEEQTKRQKV